jgi:hypothetical protein
MSLPIRRLITATAVATAALALGATSASAGVTVNDNTPFNGQTLTATVSAPPAGATQYTLAECNVTSATPANWGLDCNQASGTAPSGFGTTTKSITVNSFFTNYSFVPGQTPQHGATTVCRGVPSLAPCGVVVSWYNSTFDALGASTARLTF